MAIIDELIIYPIKGCKGFSVQSAVLNSRGLEHDREFMVVKEDSGSFISQRSYPRMCLIDTELRDGNLIVSSTAHAINTLEGYKHLVVPLNVQGDLRTVSVWGQKCSAYDCGDAAAAWFNVVLGEAALRLVRMPPPAVFARRAEQGGTVSFADQYPLLLASRESLAELNRSLVIAGETPVTMIRFRPNVVLQGVMEGNLRPFAEDMWKRITISCSPIRSSAAVNGGNSMTPTAPGIDDMTIEVKVPYPPCARCKVPTNDPDTGVLSPTNQPTKVMQVCRSGAALGMTHPKLIKHVFFGIHLALTCLVNANGDSDRVEVTCGGIVKALDRHASLNSP